MEGNVNELILDLLKGLPTEVIANDNVGTFENAVFDGAKVSQTQKGDFRVSLTFDDNGKKRFANFSLPSVDTPKWKRDEYLKWCWALGILPPDRRDAVVIKGETVEEQMAIAQGVVGAINAAATGHVVPYRTIENNKGFENSIPLRKTLA